MSFNDIIVYVDGTSAAKARVTFAVALAKEQDAHLIGIAFAPNALLPLCGADVGFADMSGVLGDVKAQGEAALKSFEACAAAAGAKAEGRLMQGMSEQFPNDFAYFARQVDLTILGQPRDGDPLVGQYALVERCLFSSGRPAMIVPAAPTELALGGTIVAAWDGSAEAARAFNDALTFLEPAKRVVLFVGVTESSGEKDEPPIDDIVAHLKRHGVAVQVKRVPVGEGDIGRLLLSQAKELEADMIVMGAFHHSRWREFILGGVTLTMLEEATIPLFMAH
ncbi:MAG: universal stress protein [Hyphomicrobiaceae bacterium]|jgi:nucleotide-binding universal stress UspA family protein|nr:universal stress protein [Methyloceanibacter sp.]MDX2316847.1 universal stress protein [Hyphomicrobiaceae bacterium]MDX2448863.1 universal stress protein [Hyphomicrobiaceae bacterium]